MRQCSHRPLRPPMLAAMQTKRGGTKQWKNFVFLVFTEELSGNRVVRCLAEFGWVQWIVCAFRLLPQYILHIIYSILLLERVGKPNVKRLIKLLLREHGAECHLIRGHVQRVFYFGGNVNDVRLKRRQACHASGNCRYAQRAKENFLFQIVTTNKYSNVIIRPCVAFRTYKVQNPPFLRIARREKPMPAIKRKSGSQTLSVIRASKNFSPS